MDSMLGKWDNWYRGVARPQAYGSEDTYLIGEKFLKGLDVEDWGCGKGYFSTVHSGGYTGVDGTATPFADVVADLTKYRSSTPGLFMRHVIEHNLEWEKVLDNAFASFTEKMILILFTPMENFTRQIAWNPGVEVPDMSFSHHDIINRVPTNVNVLDWADLSTNTQYGTERVYWFVK